MDLDHGFTHWHTLMTTLAWYAWEYMYALTGPTISTTTTQAAECQLHGLILLHHIDYVAEKKPDVVMVKWRQPNSLQPCLFSPVSWEWQSPCLRHNHWHGMLKEVHWFQINIYASFDQGSAWRISYWFSWCPVPSWLWWCSAASSHSPSASLQAC